ncbi:MAG: hypothetical protein ACTHOU_08790 [Aureliella sp.]
MMATRSMTTSHNMTTTRSIGRPAGRHSDSGGAAESVDSGRSDSAAPLRWLSAIAVVLGLALVWLVVLPWLGEQAPVRRHVDALHAADINASAMFYSELECGYMLHD